jgi:hypothetical protein
VKPDLGAIPATEEDHSRGWHSGRQCRSSPEESNQSAERSDHKPSVKSEPARSPDCPMASDSLAPFSLLRKSATSGYFTIANILNVENESHGREDSPPLDRCGDDNCVSDVNDPVNRNLINLPTAQSLFDR